MNVIAVKNDTELSEIASKMISEKVKTKSATILGLATGGTPEKTYDLLIRDHQINATSYQNVRTVNLDEYIGLASDHPQSYHYYMIHKLFQYLDLKMENTHIPNGMASDLQEECKRYDGLIESLNYPDLQILGIGSNGHIGFNEPGTPFSQKTYVTKLTESTRKANARFFHHQKDVPTHAITMGISSILKSKEILLLASGESKAKAIKELLSGEITENFPASALKLHKHVTVIADELALKEVSTDMESFKI
ncbi:glucosamine-6-phosphate deaminase [Bacillus sp. CGMCC 1.16607]|uniref:glucosamine-6-phosphate deaminase n=1 Tax=Bacillus sp. CGMCC 1.16607 TaxID=3351842 RepID=UPI0036419226